MKINKKNKIVFHPQEEFAELYMEPPKPAKNYMPDWYKDMKPFHTDNPEDNGMGGANGTAKACFPLMDAFTTGYIQETWCDIWVERDPQGKPILSINPPLNNFGSIIGGRIPVPNSKYNLPIPAKYYDEELVWRAPWLPQTPKGYSTLFTHPLNRYDLPFRSLDAVVDSDEYWGSGGYAFFLDNNFEGLIPMGTPMFQMIPFKRTDWESSLAKYDEIDMEKRRYTVQKHFRNGYKNIHWKRKLYL
jgi:hypothetical protein